MKQLDKLPHIDRNEQLLRWALRFIGLSLIVGAGFLLAHDIFHSASSVWFLRTGAALGVATLLSSWLPAAENARYQESRAYATRDRSAS